MKTNHTPKDGKLTSGSHISYWTDSATLPDDFKSLNANLETDVVIVGGGIAGVSVAYCLLKAGKKIVLIDDGFIGSGETGRTTAHLVAALDDRYYQLNRLFGSNDTRLIAESHCAAIEFIEETCLREHIECEFERLNGYLFLHPSDDKNNIHRELEAAARAGHPGPQREPLWLEARVRHGDRCFLDVHVALHGTGCRRRW